jgi:tetratricopeptide (TPR) repeat protein
MSRPTRSCALAIAAAAAALTAIGGCAMSRPVPADVRVPPELLRGAPYTAGGEPPRSRYVVRMTDGTRDWEIQLPEIATAYEVRVPLSGKPSSRLAVDMAGMTAADREIADERAAAARTEKTSAKTGNGDDDDDDDDVGGNGTMAPTKLGAAAVRAGKGSPQPSKARAGAAPAASDTPDAAKPSYLLTLARVKDLYRTRHYELALVELVELEKQYPNDEHILSMKGSLYERLGNKNLARDAWQQALTLNPFNLAVLEALQRLGK